MMIEGVSLTLGEIAREELVPEGTYRCRIDKASVRQPDAELDADGNKNYPYLLVFWKIKEDGEFLGKSLRQMMPLKPGEMWGLKMLYTKTGIADSDDFANDPDREADPEKDLVNAEALLATTIHVDKETDRKTNRIVRVMNALTGE